MRDTVCPSPTDGLVLGQQASDVVEELFVERVSEFLEALRQGGREKWLIDKYGSHYGRGEFRDAEIILDLYTGATHDATLCISQCEGCGRLWIQTQPGVNDYRCFRPDPDDGYRQVLAKPGKLG